MGAAVKCAVAGHFFHNLILTQRKLRLPSREVLCAKVDQSVATLRKLKQD